MRNPARHFIVVLAAFSLAASAIAAESVDSAWRERERSTYAAIFSDPRAAAQASEAEWDLAERSRDENAALDAAWRTALAVGWMHGRDRERLAKRIDDAIVRARAAGPSGREALVQLLLYKQTVEQFNKDSTSTALLDEAASVASTLKDDAWISKIEVARADRLMKQGRAAEVIERLTRAEALAAHEFQRATILVFMANNNAMTIYPGALKSAVKQATEAMTLLDPDTYPVLGIYAHATQAMAERKLNELEAARKNFERAIELSRRLGDVVEIIDGILPLYADVLVTLGDSAQALKVLRSNKIGQRPLYRFVEYLVQARALARQGDSAALEKLKLSSAILPELARTPSTPELFHRISGEVHAQLGHFPEALAALQALNRVSVERAERANERLRIEFQTRFDTERKERENAELRVQAQREDERRRALLWGLAASICAAVLTAALLVRLSSQQRQLRLVSSELNRRNHELEELSRSRTRLLAAACHDLRQPAHALGMLAELAVAPGAASPGIDRWLVSIRKCSATLSEMLGELMDMSRLEGGHYAPTMGPVRLSELIEEAVVQYGEVARHKGVRLHHDTPDVQVWSDRQLLRRILFNLVSNAIKYTQEGQVQIRVELEPGQALLVVRDTGPGIPAEDLDTVFEDYVRLDPKRVPEGMGIGLPIVRRAAKLLGHPLNLTSQVGRGTTVTLSIPTVAADSPAFQGATDSPQGLGRLVALLEDDRESRDAMSTLLSRWGYNAISADSAADLRTQLVRMSAGATGDADGVPVPYLLIVDLHLGGKDGLDQILEIRSWPGHADLPALLITGDLDSGVAERARQIGVQVGHKPILPARLMTYVAQTQQVLERDVALEAG